MDYDLDQMCVAFFYATPRSATPQRVSPARRTRGATDGNLLPRRKHVNSDAASSGPRTSGQRAKALNLLGARSSPEVNLTRARKDFG